MEEMRKTSFGGPLRTFAVLCEYIRTFAEIRELKQQRRRLLRKRLLKSEFALLQTLSRLFHLVQVIKYWKKVFCS